MTATIDMFETINLKKDMLPKDEIEFIQTRVQHWLNLFTEIQHLKK